MEKSFFSTKRITFLDWTVFISAIAFLVLRIYFSSGQLSPDGINYLLQAQHFWDYKINFPLGYPFLIKLLYYFTGSFFIASKIVNILAYIGIILFSYTRKFFFVPTLLIFSFYPFTEFFTQSLSEPVYYFTNYLIMYYVYTISTNDFKMKFGIYFFLLFFFLISLRFAGIFVFLSFLFYLCFLTYKNVLLKKQFLLLAFLATFGVLLYLIINYFYCGFLFGQRNHLYIKSANIFIFLRDISLTTFRDFSFLNGILHNRLFHHISFLNIWIGMSLIILTIIILYKKRKKLNFFNIYLIFSFFIIFAGVFYSYYTTRIDDDIRIKSTAYLYMIFLILINIPKKNFPYLKILILGMIILNSYTILKYSDSILHKYTKFDSLICLSKTNSINIIYKGKSAEERNHAAVLMFKAICIDHHYEIIESIQDSLHFKRNCTIHSNQIID